MSCLRPAGARALISAGLTAVLISACTLAQPTPTPTPTVTPTLEPSSTPTPTVVPTETPIPSPTPIISLIPRDLAVSGDMVYVRDVPDLLAPITRTVNVVAPWSAIGRTGDNQWLQVRFDDGVVGWLVYLPDAHTVALESLAVTGESRLYDRVALVSSAALQFYVEAGDALQDTLNQLSALRIDARTSDNAWLHGTDQQGRTGWVAADGVQLTFEIASLDTRDVTINAVPEMNARVELESGGLRLRQAPNIDATVLLNLMAGTQLAVTERTTDNAWLLVQLREGYRGWVSAQYVELMDITLDAVTANPNPQPVAYFTPPTPANAPSVTLIGGGARSIFESGRQMGNRANVFTTVGDSLTDTPNFLRNIVSGFDLGQYGYLLPVINYFNVDTGQGNAFLRRALSAKAGWSTFSVVVEERPELSGTCAAGELALDCEYRLTQPAYAIIMIGTNDAPAFPADTYRANMTRIIEISIAHGVVPILSTLPPRTQYNDRILEYNAVITQLAQLYGLPITDLYTALLPLPNQGLSPDGIHLSEPPGAPAATLIFNSANLAYGTTMRNLTVLQALAAVQAQVGY
ncbi:MAG: SH3 domain-containing protein [Chloroflexi bacterium]|nr:SH3 domain-containing protein [Chloroflexota bacterium]